MYTKERSEWNRTERGKQMMTTATKGREPSGHSLVVKYMNVAVRTRQVLLPYVANRCESIPVGRVSVSY